MSVRPYRVLITGSRSWTDEGLIHSDLSEILFAHGEITLVHGACPKGADRIADYWAHLRNTAARRAIVTVERHPADWDTHGRGAGFRRNAHMVSRGRRPVPRPRPAVPGPAAGRQQPRPVVGPVQRAVEAEQVAEVLTRGIPEETTGAHGALPEEKTNV